MAKQRPAPLETHAALATIEQALELLVTVDRAAIPDTGNIYGPRMFVSSGIDDLKAALNLSRDWEAKQAEKKLAKETTRA